MAASTHVRVFAIDTNSRDSRPLREGYRAYACYVPRRRVRSLGRFSLGTPVNLGTFGVYNFVAAGRYIAYDDVFCDRDDACRGPGIQVLDVRSGRRKNSGARTPNGSDLIRGLVLKTNGSVAWIRPRIDQTVEVRKRDAGGESVLDSGADIEHNSLALAGNTVYWTRAGTPRSALID